MFDYLRNLTKSAEEKRQEQLNAYLDGALTSQERKRFEQQLSQDAQLRADLAQLQAMKQQMRQLPRRRVPRNFILDPALYGRPRREPLVQAYPILRTATAFTALVFIFALAANLYLGSGGAFGTAETVTQTIEVPVEVTRVVTETVVEEAQVVEVTRVVTQIIIEEVIVEEEAAESTAFDEQADFAEESQVLPPEAEIIERAASEAPALPGQPAAEIASDTESASVDEGAPAQEMSATALPRANLPADEAGILGYPIPEEVAEAQNEAYLAPEEALSGMAATAVATKDVQSSVRELDADVEQAPKSPQLPLISILGVLAVLFGLLFLVLLLLLFLARRRL